MPLVKNISRSIQRIKHQNQSPYPIPQTFLDLSIPPILQVTYSNERFLIFDNESTTNRILIFSTPQYLKLLSDSSRWFCDGTFRTCPRLFLQLYTIHGAIGNTSLPFVFALLPNKNQITYTTFFQSLRNFLSNPKPNIIIADFEKAAINSLSSTFTSSRIKGCYYHFCQSIWRKINELPLIRTRYTNDANFMQNIKKIACLAFIPPSDVSIAFGELCLCEFFIENTDILAPLIKYFKSTYIVKKINNQLVDPLFPIDLWNCYQDTLSHFPRTNNSVEGWNNAFQHFVGSSHPTIFNFIEKLKSYQSINKTNLSQIRAGADIRRHKKNIKN